MFGKFILIMLVYGQAAVKVDTYETVEACRHAASNAQLVRSVTESLSVPAHDSDTWVGVKFYCIPAP